MFSVSKRNFKSSSFPQGDTGLIDFRFDNWDYVFLSLLSPFSLNVEVLSSCNSSRTVQTDRPFVDLDLLSPFTGAPRLGSGICS